ncbi:hypothetical protein ACWGHM_37095 [Streptomyces sp. NPDC054904]
MITKSSFLPPGCSLSVLASPARNFMPIHTDRPDAVLAHGLEPLSHPRTGSHPTGKRRC